MAYKRYSNYIDGNAAKVMTMPERDYERRRQNQPEREREQRREQQRKSKQKPRKKVSFISLLLTMTSIGLAMYMCISYIMLYSNVLTTEKEIATIESQIAELAADNEEAYESIETSVDLKDIYKIATNKLGMVHASKDQVYSYSNKRNDRVIQYSEIPE